MKKYLVVIILPAIWNHPSPLINLFLYTLIKFFITILSLTCPIPAGVFAPNVFIGASIGRLYGYTMHCIFGITHIGIYSVIGAAAMVSSVTHTISFALIIFELNGEIRYLLPVLLGTLMSYLVGTSLSVSFFDFLLQFRGMPFMPSFQSIAIYHKNVSDIMKKNFGYISKDNTYRDILILTRGLDTKSTRFLPYIDNAIDMHLLGVISTDILSKYLKHEVEKEANQLEIGNRKTFMEFYDKLVHFNMNQYSARSNSIMEIIEYEEKTVADKTSTDLYMKRMISKFWYSKIEIDNDSLKLDDSPFCVLSTTPISKLHFLFAMLNLKYVMVIGTGKLLGTLSKSNFIRKMKET